MDTLIHGLAADESIRCMAAITTQAVGEATRRHGTSPAASDALGRTLTGALLLGSSLKDFDRLTVRIECEGALKLIVAEVNGNGNLRGYVNNPMAAPPAGLENSGRVKDIVGGGMFNVIREAGLDVGLFRDPYYGAVELVSGEIAEDFAYYLLKSEQIPSAVMLGVALQNREPYVAAAGGLMLQLMPGANEHIVTMLEDTIRHAPNISTLVKEGADPRGLLQMALGIIEFEVLDEKPVSFACTCSMERAEAMVAMLDKHELEELIEHEGSAKMDCHFCNQNYEIGKEKLLEIISKK